MNKNYKLSREDILEIREYLAGNRGSNFLSPASISRKFGVSRQTIMNIRDGVTHGHIRAEKSSEVLY